MQLKINISGSKNIPLKKVYPWYFYRLAKSLEFRMWDRWSHGELFLLTNAFYCFTDI